MAEPLALNHLNIPAKDRAAQAKWYSEKLGFKAYQNFLWSGGTLLVFTEGEPLANEKVHFGFRVGSMDDLRGWVETLRGRGLDVPDIEGDESYARVYLADPEGNHFEIFFEPLPE